MRANAARSSSTPMVVFFLSITEGRVGETERPREEETLGGRLGGAATDGAGATWRNGIEAAGVERRAFDESNRGQNHAEDRAVRAHRFGRIL